MRLRRGELVRAGAGALLAAGSVPVWGASAGVAAAAAVAGASLAFARRHPRASWVTATLVLLATVPQGVLELPTFLLFPLVAFCAGRRDDRWSGIAGLVALIVVSELGVLVAHDDAVPALFIPAAGWGAGRALRERELLAQRLTDRAHELEEERESFAQLSVRYERARIASELHDIVAHAISVMVVQATAGQRLAAIDPQLTAETFEAIAGAAHQAEHDIGRLVALLGDATEAGQAPDLRVVEKLIERAAGSGLHVTLRLEGERDGLPAAVGQAAYRVVQEGLTNALRHAAGAPVDVLLRGDSDALVIEVVNGPATGDGVLHGGGSGTGLVGLRERVGAIGGELHTGPTADGGWRLAARLRRQAARA